jgi:F1F0 ATPase subunit 2
MEINPMLWGLAVIGGVLLGLLYFGGLWMTLQYITRTNRPKTLLGMSLIIRVCLVMVGFWIIVRKDPMLFMVTFAAFLMTRVILTRTLGRGSRGQTHAHQS